MKARHFSFLIGLLLPCFAGAEDPPRLLVYQKNGKGFVHDNLDASAAALREIGAENGFSVAVSSDPSVFSDESLKRYRALAFANTNNEGFDTDAQRGAFQRFLRGGGGYVGIHSSTGSERNWDWFQKMQGAKFLRHPPLQKFGIKVLDASHPATAQPEKTWVWEDECYFFANLNPSVHVLMVADTTILRDPKRNTEPGAQLNGVFPLAWCHEFEGGRVFYTALGHKKSCYSDPVFRKHLLGGIRWAIGAAKSPDNPKP